MDDKLVVVPPSFEIVPDDLSITKRIEISGRLCYKSEDKMTDISAPGFCRAMINHEHNSVLEMAVLTLHLSGVSPSAMNFFMKTERKYVVVNKLQTENELIVTGSIRSFREGFALNPRDAVWRAMFLFLLSKHPLFFEDLEHLSHAGNSSVYVEKVPLLTIDKIQNQKFAARHRYVAVRFIVNRAVTHEIVRHRPCAFLQESQRYCRYSEKKFGERVTFIAPCFFKKGTPEYAEWEKAMLLTEDIYLQLLKTSTPQAARTVLPNSCKTEIIVYASLAQWHHIFHMRAINKAAEPSMREIMIPVHKKFKEMFPFQNFGNPLRMPEGWIKK